MPRGEQHVPKPAVAIELESAVDGAHVLYPDGAKTALPAAALPYALDVRRNSSTDGW